MRPRLAIAVVLGILICMVSTSIASIPESSGSQKLSPINSPPQAVNGPQVTLVILARFSDRNNNTSPTQIAGTLVSVNQYYGEDSYGTLSFQTSLTPVPGSQWYTLPQTMVYYGADTVASDSQLVSDSLQAAYNAGVNLSNYKFALVVHAGDDEAISHVTADIHSFTIPGFVFSPAPLILYKISTSVVAESDPMGVYAHEFGHLLGLPDLYDLTRQIDPTNNFIGYWEIMALGEWNPNTGNPFSPKPGTYPSHHSSWSKIQLGFLPGSRTVTVQPGASMNITIQNLEMPTSGNQSVRIPIAANSDGSLTSYYLLEMRAKLAVYDQYLPFPSSYPGAGLLIYKVNESIPAGQGSVRLINAHPGGDLNSAAFGPCNLPCVSNNTYWDTGNYVKIIVTKTTPTAYSVTVDRTGSPFLLLQVNTPSANTMVSVDGNNFTSDSSREVRILVHYGPHSVRVQSQIPLSLGATTIGVGLTNSFAAWNDGSTANPRWVTVSKDTMLTATYRIVVEPSFATAATAVLILGVIATVLTLSRRKRNRQVEQQTPTVPNTPLQQPFASQSLPGDNSLPGGSVHGDDETKKSEP
ncbi:MAG TPA: M6 family metalloprotease domain-containing protein [Candidatus Bathyarchaeia archaeon]|nr:M6 family metalloprotease domain-containing protein [Candidatus Bathyarchaeia archaeon]